MAEVKIPGVELTDAEKDVLGQLRQDGNRCLLAFSRGKDSIATWIVLREAGIEVVPFHMDMLPGMSFVEESLDYYEQFFDTHIYRVTHPSFYSALQTLCSQPPTTAPVIDAMNLQWFGFKDVNAGVMRTAGLPPDTWVCVGTRIPDSPVRRMTLGRQQGLNRKLRQAYPIFNRRKVDLIAIMRFAGVKLPYDYHLFGRSFDGYDYRYLEPLRNELPWDYERLLVYFPQQDMEFARKEFYDRATNQTDK